MGRTLATQGAQVRVVEAMNMPQTRRVHRRPRHTFNIKALPFEVVPFLIAPVLPGETMENLLLQARVVSDPIKNPLIGWWHEYYFFYVKHRSLTAVWDTNGLLQTMMLDPSTSVATLKAAANTAARYEAKGTMEFVRGCYRAVINEYFRDEGEDYTTGLAATSGYCLGQTDQEGWWQSLKKESATGDDTELPGVDELEELDILPGFTSQYAQWEIMRDSGLTDLTYEDYLRSYGVSIPKSEDEGGTPDERHRPELLRFVREWTYPTNHVEPTTGAPTSAVSWSIAERADKKRFFKEPGFIFGVTVTRPKVYLGNQKGAAVGVLDNAYAWLPAVLFQSPYTSVKELTFSATDGILQNQAEDYWIDVKDLFLYGDQFVNYAPTAALTNSVSLPTAAMEKKYLTEADIKALFVTAGSENIRQDGVCHLNILSRLRDTTP